jgi:hypothetical protein
MTMQDSDGTSFAPVAWVNGWSFGRTGLALNLIRREGRQWVDAKAPSNWMLNARAYEPSTEPFARRESVSVRVTVKDLSQLPTLLDAGGLIREIVPPARDTRHSIFVVETSDGRVYVPAHLLIRELWLWSSRAESALMTPNSLDIHLSPPSHHAGAVECSATIGLASDQPSDTVLRRLLWLSQCEDARHSWSSVLVHAHQGIIEAPMPRARLDAWAWGIQLKEGVLACELMSAHLHFELPNPAMHVRIGRTSYA